jgi:hypothetical protein
MEQSPSPNSTPGQQLPDPRERQSKQWMPFLKLVGRGLVYGLCFWIAHGFIYRPFIQPFALGGSTASSSSSDSQQTKTYNEQMARTEAMYAEGERQMKRSQALIERQEALATRLEAVMTSWERQGQFR